MIRRGEIGVFTPHLAAGQPQAFKCLWRGHLMDEVPVDIYECCAVAIIAHDVAIPEFVV